MIKKETAMIKKLSKKAREKLFKVAASKAYEAEQRGDTKEMIKYRREMMDLCSY
jgi:hypothetical protein